MPLWLSFKRELEPGNQKAKKQSIVLNWTPKCRSEEARECGSEKWKARKARKVVNAGNAELGARMSGMIAKLKNIMFNDTPKCRSLAVVRFVMPGAWAKQSLLNWTPKCRSCSVVLAGRRCNGCPKQAMAVSGMKAGDVQNFGETIKPCCGGAFSLILECCDIFECG